MKSIRTILIVMAAAAVMSLGAAMPAFAAAQNANCLTDQQIQTEIASGQIKSWRTIRELGGVPADYYETSYVQVCLKGGVPYFVVKMSSSKGESVKIVLNAMDGSS
ncbi:MAG: hypothetical protein ABI398_14550 [Devosia sp.]